MVDLCGWCVKENPNMCDKLLTLLKKVTHKDLLALESKYRAYILYKKGEFNEQYK